MIMMQEQSRFQQDIANLIQTGSELLNEIRDHIKATDELNKTDRSQRGRDKYHETLDLLVEDIPGRYQEWYTESCALVKQMLPSRLGEFEALYSGLEGAYQIPIQQWLLAGGRAGHGFGSSLEQWSPYSGTVDVANEIQSQLGILRAVNRRFESSLFDLRQMVQADIFDSELEAATGLAKNGFTRAAGSLAGVVLERHLGQVTANHSISIKKRNPTMSDFNQALKDNETLDTPTWRQIQRLGDIRNLCSHNKEREPTREEVDELIAGTEKFTKTLF